MIREGKAEGWLTLPLQALQPWAAFNDVHFNGISIGPQVGQEDKGSTVLARQTLDSRANATLMTVPRDLILSLDRVHEHAKYDRDLRDVLEALGDFGKSSRGAILCFLLMQCSLACPSMPEKRGVNTALSEYVKFLPLEMLPTFWTESERALLTGTTLAPAIAAKLRALYREFELLSLSTCNIAWCATCWWDELDGLVSFDDWLQVDAMYRSRALEFPGIGDCMAPCIDMANHVGGDATAAIYEVDADGNAVLLLRDGKSLQPGEEVSITYGDAKGACEMLFSYGFLEEGVDSARELFLDLNFPTDDPLAKAKTMIADAAPGFKITETQAGIEWDGEYVWLLCVNEEDGLEFMIQQATDAGQELKAFWKQKEMPALKEFRATLEQDERWDIFHLRAVSVLQDRVATQLQELYRTEDDVGAVEHGNGSEIRERPWNLAMKLRVLEAELLEAAYSHFEDVKTKLAQSEAVTKYLGLTSGGSGGDSELIDEEEDFS